MTTPSSETDRTSVRRRLARVAKGLGLAVLLAVGVVLYQDMFANPVDFDALAAAGWTSDLDEARAEAGSKQRLLLMKLGSDL